MKKSLIIVFALFLVAGTGLAAIINEGFEGASFPPTGWSLSGTSNLWSRYAVSAYGVGTGSAKADFYSTSSGGTQSLITMTCTPSGSNDSLIFDHAYATYSGERDSLAIFTSIDGGSNWVLLVGLGGGATGPLNTGGTTTATFVPNSGQWATKRFALPPSVNKLRFLGYSRYGNNLYLDNIRIKYPPQPNDAGISNISNIGPYQNTTTEPKVLVKNYGTSSASFWTFFTIVYDVTEAYRESLYVADLAADDTVTLTFPEWTPDPLGEVFFHSAWTALSGDQICGNDTLSYISFAYYTPRIVTAELFTSTTCSPCVQANSALNGLYPTWRDSMVLVRYHMNWPSPGNDPFYAANSAENNARRYYYGVNAVPNLILNGTNYGSTGTSFAGYLASERAKPGPVVMNLEGHYDSVANTGWVKVTMTATGRILDPDLRLRYAVIEDSVSYTGTNGDPIHHQVMRDMFPDSLGSLITLNLGGTATDSQAFTYNPSWPYTTERRCQIIAFLQGHVSKDCYQSVRISFLDLLSGVNGGPTQEPLVKTALLPATPNPAAGWTAISYHLAAPGKVTLGIYDVAGRLVRTLVNESQSASKYKIIWDGRDNIGRTAANGVYFYRLTTGDFTATRKLTLIK